MHRRQDAVRQFRSFHGAGQLKRADEGRKDAQRNGLRILGLRQSFSYLSYQGLNALGIKGPRFSRLPCNFRQQRGRSAALSRIVPVLSR